MGDRCRCSLYLYALKFTYIYIHIYIYIYIYIYALFNVLPLISDITFSQILKGIVTGEKRVEREHKVKS